MPRNLNLKISDETSQEFESLFAASGQESRHKFLQVLLEKWKAIYDDSRFLAQIDTLTKERDTLLEMQETNKQAFFHLEKELEEARATRVNSITIDTDEFEKQVINLLAKRYGTTSSNVVKTPLFQFLADGHRDYTINGTKNGVEQKFNFESIGKLKLKNIHDAIASKNA